MIVLQKMEKTGIGFIDEAVNAFRLIEGLGGYPRTEVHFPVNSDGITVSLDPGVFNYEGVRRSYYAKLDDCSYENVEKHVEKARKEFEAWLEADAENRVYNKRIPQEQLLFKDSKQLKDVFNRCGFKTSDKRAVELFNTFKHPLQEAEGV